MGSTKEKQFKTDEDKTKSSFNYESKVYNIRIAIIKSGTTT